MKITFLGLGVMGFPMAGFISRQFERVDVYNRTQSKLVNWAKQYNGNTHVDPIEAVKHADVVCLCVGRDEDVVSLLQDKGLFNHMNPGAIVVDHSTTSAELAKQMAHLAVQHGCHYLDAPISGGQSGAEQGILTTMVGGDETAYNKALPVMECYSKSVKRMGESGAGQLTKMVNQICIAGLVQGLAEGIHFAEKTGLDVMQVVDVISKGAAQSWQMENRHETMLAGKYDYGFAVDWMRKDLGYALDEAKRNGSTLPVTALVDQFYADVQQMGGSRWDTSSLLARLKR